MTFFLVSLVYMYFGRRVGWTLSRSLLYTASTWIAVLLCVLWGCVTALIIRYLIVWQEPGIVLRIIMGYALGSYVAIPNYGLFDEATVPGHTRGRHLLIGFQPSVTYVALSIALPLHRVSPRLSLPLCGALVLMTAVLSALADSAGRRTVASGWDASSRRRTPTGKDTPLHEAAAHGCIDEAEALLSDGAKVNARGMNGDTPLHDAALYAHSDIARLLVEKGADVTVRNRDRDTPLHHAAHDLSAEVAALLLMSGAEVNVKNRDGQTPLLLAAMLHNEHMVRLLLEHGADVNTSDAHGFTPLHHALMSAGDSITTLRSEENRVAWLGIGSMLLEGGANPNARDNMGLSVLDYTDRCEAIADLLRRHGAVG